MLLQLSSTHREGNVLAVLGAAAPPGLAVLHDAFEEHGQRVLGVDGQPATVDRYVNMG